MDRAKRLAVRVGLWLAQWGGWREAAPTPPCALAHLPNDDQVELVRALLADIRERFMDVSGDYKRREALRVLLNIRPQAKERDLNLLIELALQ